MIIRNELVRVQTNVKPEWDANKRYQIENNSESVEQLSNCSGRPLDVLDQEYSNDRKRKKTTTFLQVP
jgi:hypothetical protein